MKPRLSLLPALSSLLPALSSLLQPCWQRRSRVMAQADTASDRSSRPVATAWTGCKRQLHILAGLGRLWRVRRWSIPVLAFVDAPERSLPPEPGAAPLSPLGAGSAEQGAACPPSCLPVRGSTEPDPALLSVRWGLQLFLALACAICSFPEHPCRICVSAG